MSALLEAKLLSLAVLLIGISFHRSEAKEICSMQFPSKELSDIAGNLKNKKFHWQWICKDSKLTDSAVGAASYELDNEEPKKRVRRGWGSRRRVSSSSSRWSSSYGSRRRTSSWSLRRRTATSSSRRRATSFSLRRRSFSSSIRRRSFSSSLRRRSISSSLRRRSVSSSLRRRRGWFGGKRSNGKQSSRRDSKKQSNWDKVHNVLDVAGMVPGVGNVADGINAGLHAIRGNWKDAALSAAAMIPGAGQGVTAGKLTKKSKNLKEFVSKSVMNRKPHKNRKGKYESTRTTHESYDVAKKVFEKETGVKPGGTGVTHSKTKDGKYHLTVRDKSKYTKEATMDVKDTKTGDVVKIRCQGECKKP